MKNALNFAFIAFLLCVVSVGFNPAKAAKPKADFVQLRDGQSFEIRSDRAYVQMRYESNTTTMTVMLLRMPNVEELAAYESAREQAHREAGKKAGVIENFVFAYDGPANLYELNPKKSFGKNGKIFTTIVELPPGDYVVYGLGWNGFLQQCFCFGTVGFVAKAGEISDIGKFLVAKAWEPSAFPELKGEDDKGAIAQMDYGLFAAGIKPSTAEELPSHPKSQKVVLAKFNAIGAYRELNTILMNRLAPMPGVLSYSGGSVIDASTGNNVPPNF